MAANTQPNTQPKTAKPCACGNPSDVAFMAHGPLQCLLAEPEPVSYFCPRCRRFHAQGSAVYKAHKATGLKLGTSPDFGHKGA